MNNLRRVCGASLLVIVFVFSAFAGEISTPGVISPPPGQDSRTCDKSASGVTPGEASSGEAITIDSATEVALYLFDRMMHSIF